MTEPTKDDALNPNSESQNQGAVEPSSAQDAPEPKDELETSRPAEESAEPLGDPPESGAEASETGPGAQEEIGQELLAARSSQGRSGAVLTLDLEASEQPDPQHLDHAPPTGSLLH